MEYNLLDNGWHQVPFVVEQDGNVYRDALVLTSEEYNTLTAEMFETIKQQRYQSWKDIQLHLDENPHVDVPTVAPRTFSLEQNNG